MESDTRAPFDAYQARLKPRIDTSSSGAAARPRPHREGWGLEAARHLQPRQNAEKSVVAAFSQHRPERNAGPIAASVPSENAAAETPIIVPEPTTAAATSPESASSPQTAAAPTATTAPMATVATAAAPTAATAPTTASWPVYRIDLGFKIAILVHRVDRVRARLARRQKHRTGNGNGSGKADPGQEVAAGKLRFPFIGNRRLLRRYSNSVPKHCPTSGGCSRVHRTQHAGISASSAPEVVVLGY